MDVRHFVRYISFVQSKRPQHDKIRRKPCFFTSSDHHLQFISEIRRIRSHFISKAAVKASLICNLGPFSHETNCAYFQIQHTLKLQIIALIHLKMLKYCPQFLIFRRKALRCKLQIHNDCKSAHFLGRFDRNVPGFLFGFVISVWRKNTLGTRLHLHYSMLAACLDSITSISTHPRSLQAT